MAPHSDNSNRVLVTGLSGFTGQYVRDALARRGYEAVDPRSLNPCFNLTAPETVQETVNQASCRFVIHLAAISFVGHADASAFYRVNTIGTDNLLAALARSAAPPQKVIVSSSANIYGNTDQFPINEETLPAPTNHYACSKLAMEHITKQWFCQLPIIVTRPFNYTGRKQAENFLIPKIVSHFRHRAKRLELGNLDVIRDFSDVRMVAESYARLLDSPLESQIFNICSGIGHSLRWIVEECSRQTGHTLELISNPAFVRPNEIHRLVGCNKRLQEAVGDMPEYSMEQTLNWMLTSNSE